MSRLIEALTALPQLYSNYARSENPKIQIAIDWAPSIIMAIGIQLAPKASLAFGIFGFASHAVIPKIFPIDLTKTFLTGIALNVGTHAMIHGIIPLMYMTAATVLYVAAQHLNEIKHVAGLLKNEKFDQALYFVKLTAFNAIASFTDLLGDPLENFIRSIASSPFDSIDCKLETVIENSEIPVSVTEIDDVD